eukprot:765104-Hanusia_phi.AAC.17
MLVLQREGGEEKEKEKLSCGLAASIASIRAPENPHLRTRPLAARLGCAEWREELEAEEEDSTGDMRVLRKRGEHGVTSVHAAVRRR